MSFLTQLRRAAWKASAVAGDAQAIERAVEQGTPAPVIRRAVRKRVYRTGGRATRTLLRSLGL